MMKDFDYYSKPQTHYPKKDEYTTVYLYDKGEVLWSGDLLDYTHEIKQKYPEAIVQKTVDQDQYLEQLKAYGTEKHKLEEEFINDLFDAFQVKDNPKREAAYALAYEYGHNGGFSEIYHYFYDIVELIKN